MAEALETERVPYNADAERAVLGGILLDNSVLEHVADLVGLDDFFLDQHRQIYTAMLDMERGRKAIDLVTLVDYLQAAGKLAAAGGEAYVAQILDGMPRSVNVQHYARIIKEDAHRRDLLVLSSQVSSLAGKRGEVSEIIERMESGLSAVRDGEISRSAVTVKDAVHDARPMLERAGRGDGAILGIPTGYRDLDNILAGWIPGEVVLLGARPSMGKTALAGEFAVRQARAGNSVAIISLETSRENLVLRMSCLLAKVDSHQFRRGRLSKEHHGRLRDAVEELENLPIWIDDRGAVAVSDLRWRLRSLAHRHGIKLAIVDYLQLLHAGKNVAPGYQEVSEVSRALKEIGKELGQISGGTVLALCQLNRLAARERPQLHHLRESGQLEQDADVVLFIYNSDGAEIVPGQATPYKKVIEIAKQKNGPLDLVELLFVPPWMGFEPIVTREEDWLEKESLG